MTRAIFDTRSAAARISSSVTKSLIERDKGKRLRPERGDGVKRREAAPPSESGAGGGAPRAVSMHAETSENSILQPLLGASAYAGAGVAR